MRWLLLIALLGCDGEPTIDGGTPADSGREDAGRDDAGMSEGCALPRAFDVGVTYERTLYVAVDGDAGGDGSQSAPLTLEEAMRRATPGTRVVMSAGTYAASYYFDGLTGEATRPIAIVGEGDVILDAGGGGEAMHVSRPSYLVIENLTIQNTSANGINIDDGGAGANAANVVLRDLVVRDVGTGGNSDCIKLSGLDRFFVEGGDLSGCNAGDAIDMVGCHDGVIRGVYIHDTPGGGIQAKGGSSGTIMHGNRFVDVAGRSVNAGGSTGDEFFRPIDAAYEARELYIVANVFVRSGAESGAPIAFVGCDGCVFANNTIVDPLTWVARILQERAEARFVPCRDGVFANNLVALDVDVIRTFVNVGGGTAPETFTFDHNLWWAQDRDASWAGPTFDAPLPPERDGVIQMDPMFADSEYRIGPSSPAIGRGRTIEGPAYPDFDGQCYSDPPAIGAFTAGP
jgi:hypothetical protein